MRRRLCTQIISGRPSESGLTVRVASSQFCFLTHTKDRRTVKFAHDNSKLRTHSELWTLTAKPLGLGAVVGLCIATIFLVFIVREYFGTRCILNTMPVCLLDQVHSEDHSTVYTALTRNKIFFDELTVYHRFS